VNHIKMKHRRKKIKKISNIKLVYWCLTIH
jgi:hypothetical protein